MDLKDTFLIIVLFTICQRLYELTLSKKNEAKIVRQKGFIVPEKNYIFMVALHTSWLVYLFYQAIWGKLNIDTKLFVIGTVVFFLGQTLRIMAIRTLGSSWTTRIAILPEQPAIKNGLFNLIRHPNYLGVCFEIFALPMMIGHLNVALIFSTINLIILFFRIRTEENFLKKYSSYSEIFKSKRVVSP